MKVSEFKARPIGLVSALSYSTVNRAAAAGRIELASSTAAAAAAAAVIPVIDTGLQRRRRPRWDGGGATADVAEPHPSASATMSPAASEPRRVAGGVGWI